MRVKSETEKNLPPSLSSGILSKLIGKKVVGLVRYSWWSKGDIYKEFSVENDKAFSLTAGPLAVIFEGQITLGIASDPSINSVVVWLDRVNGKSNVALALDEDSELFKIDSFDETYADLFWSKFKNCTLVGFSILKKKSMTAAEKELPSEVGLSFYFNNGEKFIATHGLHDGSDDFSVLSGNSLIELIADEILEEVPLL